MLETLLSTIEDRILPLTRTGVAAGNKIFGAAILNKADRSLVLAETNNETANPLWHGEMHVLKRFYEMPANSRPATSDCLFLSTHEPCSLCLSAITWAGFDNFYYLFSHEDSRDAFQIPHDLRILKEVFTLEPGGYNATNAYWTAHPIATMIAELPAGQGRRALEARVENITQAYAALSQAYQDVKERQDIPLR
ncbi:MAG: nucleoside deaminase [Alphaproteobacteria bacterium]